MSKIKPILFNTDMVRAILYNRKTVTRRVVKPQPFAVKQDQNAPCWCGHFVSENGKVQIDKPPYLPGDILYVRETWRLVDFEYIDGDWSANVSYKADCGIGPRLRYLPHGSDERCGWRPSIHMPSEAARIFLRVTDVRVERLQDITELDILEKEGVTVDFPQPKPSYMSLAYAETRLKPAVRKAFADLWNRAVKPADRALYGWDANHWVWVIEFERCEKPEEVK